MMLELRNLEEKDEEAFFEGMKHWVGEDPHWYSFCWKEGMTFAEMLQILRNDRAGVNLPPERVPHSMLYGFVGGKIIGRLSVRHTLNEKLRYRGGHIGYAVAPPFRRKGYAKEMVRQGLAYCRNLGLSKIMITCADDNEPSWKVIEGFGGKLEDKVWDNVDNETIRRYWVDL
jgi:predicted acetyltransferase